ncbi:GNAT family N-acetyltransferase [Rhizobium ruizarguesonis]|jgi:GNAT superfamily N-acetyltransferase|uniref:GNAT family N-acetyltransferase n=1 Tax=Rhizobium ruizarguesonis TaxID=2081791 RepID=A0ABY1X644_9HYPH|nr:GNAT family N-acetyltransferase [Rhizobium ruizarguesonis]TAT77660.1 GNAT family N-acetyltransferase [Rhizobium ruizarguesonis]TAT87531.1 GNAT family N-acetyltransferase [Rhizobium ruizarguesonis]TAU67276.1 GNAT family N-acetyltransferase [Rhizobium ruizarguesonis]TAU75548.1 GNAT family N-acetyltransferase [Rhizobium ruizarguesonis]TAV31887.1 GNAT family N-acetyltransferase [Rhizobium ruizarguesonis]
MNEPRFPNDEGEDAWIVVQVSADEHWNAYHDIRRAVLFEARGLIGYDASHPDDRRDGYFPLLLLLENTPVGAARLDLMDDAAACVRTVAIRAECQGKGYGRMLMTGLEKFASQHGVERLVVNAARDAVGFYGALGWTAVEAGGDNPVLTKELRTGP